MACRTILPFLFIALLAGCRKVEPAPTGSYQQRRAAFKTQLTVIG